MAPHRTLFRLFAVAAAALTLAACSETASNRKATAAIPAKLVAEMKAKGMTRTSPVLVRVYKQESELEVWKKTNSGRYALLKTYPICRWSGQLGPKKTEGDRQVPEGFYSVSTGSLNPNSRFYLSFDVGYPNAYDRSHGRSGGNIMVHGACSSRGCFAMTDQEIAEIYAVAREALQAGQPSFQLQSFPFRMTAENIAKHRRNPNIGFWRELKTGADTFEVTKQPVQVAACGGRYAFNGSGCGQSSPDPSVVAAVQEKQRRDEERVAALVASGAPAVSVIYEDGGSNPVYARRSVDGRAIPGRDKPYSTVREPVVVALNDQGLPATASDAQAAARATYSAAETLLMAEANLARRKVGPQKPDVVEKRQQVVYARLLGNKMPAKPKPDPAPVVVAAAETPAPAEPVLAQAESAPEAPFYSRLLSFVSASDEPETPSAPAARAVAAAAGAQGAKADDAPFYRRWLGLGSSEDDGLPIAAPVEAGTAAGDVPVPPSRPRLAATPGKAPIFTSLGQ